MKEVWKTAGDEKVCATCRALEGQTFEQGAGPMPPLHPGCRCSRQPVPEAAAAFQRPGGVQPVGGPFAQQPGPQPIQGLQPRRAVPSGGAPQETRIEYGAQTLVQPAASMIPVSAGGRVVGAFAGSGATGEFVPYQQPEPAGGALGPMARPGKEEVAFRKELQENVKVLKEYRKTHTRFIDWVKEILRPGGAGRGAPEGPTSQHAVQARLGREWEAQRAAQPWDDPYSGAYEAMRGMVPSAREQQGVSPESWKTATIRGRLAQLSERVGAMAPQNRQESLQSAVFAMYAAKRGWAMTAGQLQGWAQEYGQFDLSRQQAAFAQGGEMPAMGPYQEMQTAKSRWQNLTASLGQSAWENFGFMTGVGGMEEVKPTAMTGGATLALGLGAPWMGAKLAGGALARFGAPTAAGFMGGVVAPAMATGASVLGGAAVGGAVSNILGERIYGEQWERAEGLGGTLGQLSRYGRQGLFLGGRALAQGLRRLGIGPQGEEEWAESQKWMVNLLGLDAQEARQQSPLDMLSEKQRLQLQAQATAVIGKAPGTGLMETLAQKGPLLGFSDPGKYLGQLQQVATRAGYMPGGAEMGGALQELAGMGRTELLQAQQAAGQYSQLQGLFGEIGGLGDFAGKYVGMGAPERRRLGMLAGGNRQLWSDLGRRTGDARLVTMEEGGLPLYTTEMRGLQEKSTQQQRGYRDWALDQRAYQQEQSEIYTRAGWGIQDRQRQLQAGQAQWGFGYQERAFALGGQQWAERFDLGGRQQQEAMALGRQVFETRVGYQAQDLQQQQGRQQQQYQWRQADWSYQESRSQLSYGWQMEDLSEAVRYSTGRQRRQLMKQQERGVISESMRRAQSEEQRERMEETRQWQVEDFEKQKQRNEELLALQREQWELRRKHFEENRELVQRQHEEDREMAEERMNTARQFYDEGKELSDERLQLQRQHQEQQMEWAQIAIEKSKEHNAQMDRLADATRDYQREQQNILANWSRLLVYSEELSTAFLEFLGEARSQVPEPTERQQIMGMQHGGFVEKTGRALIHQGEHVVPVGGQLVLHGDNPESLEQLKAIVTLITQLVAIGQSGKSSVVIVDSNRPQRAAHDHDLSLADEGWAVMPTT